MNESILTSVKKMLGISEDDTAFDTEIIIYINTTFMLLKQIGIGPSSGYRIDDANALWADFISSEYMLGDIQTYVYARVRMLFDPPTNSVLTSLDSIIRELEWRLNVEVDPSDVT